MKNHPYHLVTMSPWPAFIAMSVFTSMSGLVKWLHLYNMNVMLYGISMSGLIMLQWWRDVIRESTFQGHHTFKVSMGLQWGMILFIISEIFLFISFFWSFFHSSLSPSLNLGLIWPPKGIMVFNPLEIPLLNTMILITSGLTITWTHHSLMENNYKQTIQSLFITVLLGISFSLLQVFEYFEASFTISDSVYGSLFFITTGLHGMHVIIGSIFLLINHMRLLLNHLSIKHHLGFEMAAWYWHFVDVVWLFLYISIYWWGS